jgi:hypothetical protein
MASYSRLRSGDDGVHSQQNHIAADGRRVATPLLPTDRFGTRLRDYSWPRSEIHLGCQYRIVRSRFTAALQDCVHTSKSHKPALKPRDALINASHT